MDDKLGHAVVAGRSGELSREGFMNMDHRWGMREPIEREVVMACTAPMPLYGCTRDVSFSGIFVSLPQATPRLNTLVDLVVTLRSGGVTSIHRIMAAAVRFTERGIGFMFARLDPGEVTRFLTLLHGDNSFLVVRQPDPRRIFVRSSVRDGMFMSVAGRQEIKMTAVTADADPCPDSCPATEEDHDYGQMG